MRTAVEGVPTEEGAERGGGARAETAAADEGRGHWIARPVREEGGARRGATRSRRARGPGDLDDGRRLIVASSLVLHRIVAASIMVVAETSCCTRPLAALISAALISGDHFQGIRNSIFASS